MAARHDARPPVRLVGSLARHLLVAVNDDKRPTQSTIARATAIQRLLPAGWENVSVAAWLGVTTFFVPSRPELATMSSTAVRALRT
jgi:pantetheine-phosphate adenylyltransferase